MMRRKLIRNLLLVLVTICLIIPQVLLTETGNQVLAEEPPPEPPSGLFYPGRIVATGTLFEIQDSESANITLASTEEVKVVLDSVPGMISLIIEAAGEGTDNTVLTLGGLEPNKTYYKYEDDFGAESAFVSDENGSYIWTQDLTRLHLVWIQEKAATILIPEQASTYGTWDDATRTFTLQQDLTEAMEITGSNITLDGNGHTIRGDGSDCGIFSYDTADVIVKNFNIEEEAIGIRLFRVRNATLSNCTISNNWAGIQFIQSPNSTINSNNVLSNVYGIDFTRSSDSTINGNNVLSNVWGIIILPDSSNITVNDNIVSNQSYVGIGLIGYGCHNNNIRNNTVSNNQLGVYFCAPDDGNRIYHNNFIENVEKPQAFVFYSSASNLFDDGYPSGGNYWSDYIGIDQYRGPNQDQQGSDGIGDTPYTFYGFEDRYPFMSPLGVLSADFSWSPDKPVIGDNITFDASNSTGEIVSYFWDFGDNTTATTGNATITHTYQNVGVFPVSLTVTSSDNETASVVKEVTIRPWSFAVITDLHIGWGIPDYGGQGFDDGTSGQGYYMTERLEEVVSWLNQYYNNPVYNIKFLVLTGDIADTAERSEFLKIREILNGLEIPYIPVIGNHDIWPYVAKINKGPDSRSTHFLSGATQSMPLGDEYFEEIFWGEQNQENRLKIENLFGEGVFVRQEEQEGNQGFPYLQNYAFSYGGIHFVALDFQRRAWEHVPSTIHWEDLHQGTINWLEGELAKYDEERVIVFHHNPFISIWGTGGFTYSALNYMRGIIIGSNCEVFNFAGHLHRNLVQTPADAYTVVETMGLWQSPPYSGEFMRIVQVGGVAVEDINYDILIDEFTPAMNPYFKISRGEVGAGDEVTFIADAKNRSESEISSYVWNFGDDHTHIGLSPKYKKTYESAGNYTVNLTIADIYGASEEISWVLTVNQTAPTAYNYDLDTTGLQVVLGEDVDMDLTEPDYAQNTAEWAVVMETASPGKPIGALLTHFELATQDIDLSGIHADIDLDAKKSVLYRPTWPSEVEEIKWLYIPYSENGTVYICPNATSLSEVNPQAPGTVFLEPGEIVNGMMAVPTIYDGEFYYLVYGFTGGGGGVNLPPIANANGPYAGEEGSPVTLTASNSTDPNGDPLKYRWDFNDDGSWDTDWLTSANITYSWYDDYAGAVIVEVWDGEFTDNATATVNVINVAPTIVGVTAPLVPVMVGTEISTTANFTDPGTADTHVAIWDWGDNSTSTGYVDEAVCFVSGNHTYTATGVYTVKLTVTDDDGAPDESIFHYVVVYDPSAGFVTGGGWIDSPTGAYPADPSLTGKSNFGFFIKYQQGANTPTGQTEFLFKPTGLNFHSTSYEWLVINGAKAILKGEGTINSEGSYKFRITVIDAEIDPNDGFNVDRFRIRIWEEVGGNEVVIYDNALGDDSDSALTELGGGSIVIH